MEYNEKAKSVNKISDLKTPLSSIEHNTDHQVNTIMQ